MCTIREAAFVDVWIPSSFYLIQCEQMDPDSETLNFEVHGMHSKLFIQLSDCGLKREMHKRSQTETDRQIDR